MVKAQASLARISGGIKKVETEARALALDLFGEDPENNKDLTNGVMFAYHKDKTVVFDIPAALKRAKKVAPALVKTVWVHKTKFEVWAKGLLTSDPDRAEKFVRVDQVPQVTFKKSLLPTLLEGTPPAQDIDSATVEDLPF